MADDAETRHSSERVHPFLYRKAGQRTEHEGWEVQRDVSDLCCDE